MSPHNDTFRIEFPEGWEDRTVHYFMGPEMHGIQHSLTLMLDREVSTKDVAAYARDRIDNAIETMPNATLLKEEPKTMPSGYDAYEAVYKWVPPNGVITFQRLLFIIHDGCAYTFTASFSKRSMKTIGVEVERIINTFAPGSQD